MFIESQKKLNEYHRQNTEDECYNNQMDDDKNDITNTDLLEDPFSEIQDCMTMLQCNDCFEIFHRESELNAHSLLHRNDKQNATNEQIINARSESTENITDTDQNHDKYWIWACNWCDTRFQRRQALQNHRRRCWNRENSLNFETKEQIEQDDANGSNPGSIEDYRWKCTKCIISFRTRDLLRNHNRQNHRYNRCDNTVYDSDNMYSYMELNASKLVTPKISYDQKHDLERWKCSICHKVFRTRKLLRQHRSLSHKFASTVNVVIDDEINGHNVIIENRTNLSKPTCRSWNCSICGAVFTRRQLLQDHRMREHTSSAAFTSVKEEPEDSDIEFFAEDYSYEIQN